MQSRPGWIIRQPGRFFDGTAGQALFFAYLDAAREGKAANDRALDILGQSIDALAEKELRPDLYTGFCGIGWAGEWSGHPGFLIGD